MSDPIVITLPLDVIEAIDNRTFQCHRIGNTGKARLYPVSIETEACGVRCPVVVGGEQCGQKAGHEGKHMWASGD